MLANHKASKFQAQEKNKENGPFLGFLSDPYKYIVIVPCVPSNNQINFLETSGHFLGLWITLLRVVDVHDYVMWHLIHVLRELNN